MLAAIGVVIGFVGVWLFLLDYNNNFAPALLIVSIVLMVAQLFMEPAKARDLGQWGNVDPKISEWYRSLKQPDNNVSCCGEADSYYCDEHARGDQVYCIIADDRDNETLRRTPVPNGTAIDIPDTKINRDPNLAGRAIVFLSSGGRVYCFIGAGGV